MSPARTVEVNHSQVTVDDTWSEMDDPADLGQKTSRNETETRTKRCPCENAYKKDSPSSVSRYDKVCYTNLDLPAAKVAKAADFVGPGGMDFLQFGSTPVRRRSRKSEVGDSNEKKDEPEYP